MDDHLHVLTRPYHNATSMRLAAAWKSISSHQLCRAFGRIAPVWQRDTYQRWVRSPGLVANRAEHIRSNPRRRWPDMDHYPWVLPSVEVL